jgi:hypothetical protein
MVKPVLAFIKEIIPIGRCNGHLSTTKGHAAIVENVNVVDELMLADDLLSVTSAMCHAACTTKPCSLSHDHSFNEAKSVKIRAGTATYIYTRCDRSDG